ncbi:hypothetical protein V499_04754 [Pseudogymnoascus sp. VKM F-103]|nr:hypothetical protein V499_04754 [Pseudogymnoascus sp. VKM F-103]
MSETRLDQIIKGAPQGDAPAADTTTASGVADPLAHLPSSPPQIYLNLLILEASLRAQYLELRARRRQHTFFLTLLALWTGYFAYALFLAPREDGSGVGGSVYWVVEVAEKVCLMGGVVTAVLVWGTGQWERGIRWPRRWVGVTNRGLRGFNYKIVVVKGPWWKEWMSTFSFFFSSGLLLNNGSSTYRYIPPSIANPTPQSNRNSTSGLPNIAEHVPSKGHEEDLSPGGDTISLLLLPKPFSPTFRENWDLYRTEYWERENERRRVLLQKLRKYEREHAKKQSWWKKLLGVQPVLTAKDIEKHGHHHNQSVHRMGHLGLPADKEKRLRSGSVRSGSHSRTNSRSNTPTPSARGEDEGGGSTTHSRRSSTASSTAGRKKRPSSNLSTSTATTTRGLRELRPATSVSSLSAASASEKEESRSTTPELAKREIHPTSSFTSDASVESGDGEAKEEKEAEKEAEPRRVTRGAKPQDNAEGEAIDVKTEI